MGGNGKNWTSCSKSCESGNQTRVRFCNDTHMAYGGDKSPSNPSYKETMDETRMQQQQDVWACNEHICSDK